jgi:hypothetical protein
LFFHTLTFAFVLPSFSLLSLLSDRRYYVNCFPNMEN